MTEPSLELARARELLAVTPPPGARARVLAAVLDSRRPVAQKPLWRALVLVTALLVTTTAAAVGGPALARWAGRQSRTEFARSPGTAAVHPARPLPHGGHAAPAHASPAANPPLSADPPPAVPPLAPSAMLAPTMSPPLARPRSSLEPPPPLLPNPSLLAQEVAAYREAAALVATSPGLAIVRLRAHRERFPGSALGPEVSLRLVQAFTALGRSADARREAQSFLARYPRSPKRAEMLAIVDGAPAIPADQ
jgi:TolA-binding protein